MNHPAKPPLFCDNCSSFAMAELDGVYLCSGCLMRTLLSSADASLFDKIEPIELRRDAQPIQDNPAG